MPRPEDRIGTLLGGKYRIEALLATGGMGLVYAARHQQTQRAVAIKLLRPELATRPDLVRRVSAEARLAVEAAHPNVVEVLDAGADDRDVPYVVLERLYGKPLDALIDAPLSLLSAAQVSVPVINALVRLHAAGIVHRDIKPSNIFVSGRPGERVTPKLLDFGIAKALEGSNATLSGIALGTPAYMAPEQALGAATVGPATDVWSIGVVLVRCLTGKMPFEGTTASRVGVLRHGLQPEDLPGVAEPVASLLRSALQFEPGERPRDMLAFRGALLAALCKVSAVERWPNETSVSYASAECELGRALDVEHEPASIAGEPVSVAGRPEHVMTKTLALETRTLPPRRPRSVRRGLLALALVAAGTLLSARAYWRAAPSLAENTASLLPPAPSTSIRDTSSASRAPAAASPPETLPRAPATLEAPAPRESAPAASAKPNGERAKRVARRLRSAAPEPTSPPNPLGANRSPIIE